nr:cytochrome P450 [Acidimangrovimonas sediminis]
MKDQLPRISQSPVAPDFVQDPYVFYDRARALGKLVWWDEYDMPCAVGHAAVNAILRDRRFGRPPPERVPAPAHLAAFHALDDLSLLELEPPAHTRLRKLVLRAFTTARIAALEPEIAALSHQLIEALPEGGCDLIPAFAQRLPVIVIARLLGVPEERAGDLLRWSNAMVAMYQARRDRALEDAAASAAAEFASFIDAVIEARHAAPRDDLISHLNAARDAGEQLTRAEKIATCVLLLNAGHEATVHTLGNGVKALVETGTQAALSPDRVDGTVEEILRHDPALHLFTRYAYDDIEVMGRTVPRGARVACLLAAGNRDPGPWEDPARFDPSRPVRPHLSFGAGLHFCLGAPLARLELRIALPILFARLKGLHLRGTPRYANLYHFHGLEALKVGYDKSA